ncbi:hypothetical protein [Acidianus sulfidivorans]|uniref:hypothetical protein n=1 Tax=Acidianus sulfidivorans TaxID=312539 RepID=UPI001F0EEA4A|nr:hypothetical protein [Acidianus sulfidivorans]
MIDKFREEIILGTLLFLSSFFLGTHYFYFSIILIYALASYLQLRYFAPIVSSILLLFSPFHALLVLVPYPLLFINRRFSLSFLLSTFFALLTKNYLVILLAFSLEKRGLISSGLFFLILAGILMNVEYGNVAFFLLVSGVISALIEEKIKIDIKTSAAVYLSSLLIFFKIPYLIPFLLSFSPLSSLLFLPFYPFLALISIKYFAKRFKKIKLLNIVPTLLSFLYPSLSLSASYDMVSNNKSTTAVYEKLLNILYYLIPFIYSLYFIIQGEYDVFQFLALSTIFLIGLKFWKYLSRVKNGVLTFSPYLISVALLFLAFDLYYLNTIDFVLLSISAIVISFPVKIDPLGLPLGFLSLINPIVGLSSSISRFSFIFLLIPLIGYIYFHFSILAWIFYAIGVSLYLIRISRKKIRSSIIILSVSIIYFAYSLYLFAIGYLTETIFFLIISIIIGIISIKFKSKTEDDISQLISYLAVSFPLPVLSLPFYFIKNKLGNISLLLDAIITIFIIKYLPIIHFIFILT